MPLIPFKLPDDGFTELRGTVRADDEFVILHLETSFMGEFNKKQRVVKIEHEALEDAYLKKGLFRDRICLVPKAEELLKAIPGSHIGELVLKTSRRNRADAEDLIETIDRYMVGF